MVRNEPRVKIVGILTWYDERPDWLAGVVSGMAKAQITHVVAVDGAYALYPDGTAMSSPDQHAAIVETARSLDMGVTIHVPRETFIGNEVEKRNLSLRLAELEAIPWVDWYFILDADHFIRSSLNLLDRLADTDADVASVRLYETYTDMICGCQSRDLFRAIPGLYYDGNHYTVRTPDGRNLRGIGECLIVPVDVEHRSNQRHSYRADAKSRYYVRRDETGAERTYANV